MKDWKANDIWNDRVDQKTSITKWFNSSEKTALIQTSSQLEIDHLAFWIEKNFQKSGNIVSYVNQNLLQYPHSFLKDATEELGASSFSSFNERYLELESSEPNIIIQQQLGTGIKNNEGEIHFEGNSQTVSINNYNPAEIIDNYLNRHSSELTKLFNSGFRNIDNVLWIIRINCSYKNQVDRSFKNWLQTNLFKLIDSSNDIKVVIIGQEIAQLKHYAKSADLISLNDLSFADMEEDSKKYINGARSFCFGVLNHDSNFASYEDYKLKLDRAIRQVG
jgi:hypothetical protein